MKNVQLYFALIHYNKIVNISETYLSLTGRLITTIYCINTNYVNLEKTNIINATPSSYVIKAYSQNLTWKLNIDLYA